MYTKIINSYTLDDFYQSIISLWNGIDYIGISNEVLSFRYNDEIATVNKELNIINIGFFNEKIFLEKKYLKDKYIKSFFLNKEFVLEINKINWFGNPYIKETFINNNDKILVDLNDLIKTVPTLSDFRYNSILILNNNINKLELLKRIYNIYNKQNHIKKFIEILYKYRNDDKILQKCIEEYNDINILNSLIDSK